MQPKVKLSLILILIAVCGLVMTAPLQVWGATFQTRIVHDDDDVKEDEGRMRIHGNDLDVGDDNEHIGLRFRNVTIPKGSTINSAQIVLTAAEYGREYMEVDIRGEDVGDAPEWGTEDDHLTDRMNANQTSARVQWRNRERVRAGGTYVTPDFANVVQEIISNPGWASGNAMVFVLFGFDDDIPAESHDHSPSKAPLLVIDYTPPGSDTDGDGVADAGDNCMLVSNSAQTDTDADGVGDACDNCPSDANADQADSDGNGIGDACDAPPGDADADGILDGADNCPQHFNPLQEDADGDGVGNDCDNCPDDFNPDQQDTDGMGFGDACDADSDGDGILDGLDNCPTVANADQADADGDGAGDACDAGDGAPIIAIDDKNLGASCYEHQSVNDLSFTIENIGTAGLDYTISITYNLGSGWLDLSPTTGGSLGITETATYTVHYDTLNGAGADDDLVAGSYEAVIRVEDANDPTRFDEIVVTLKIWPPPVENASCGHVPLYTENLGSPSVLLLLDISSSMGAKDDVSDMAENPRAEGLEGIVSEIVTRDNWQSGNAMVFLLQGDGSGDRVAMAFDGLSGSAPLLHVEYNDGTAKTFERRILRADDDAREKVGQKPKLNEDSLELGKDGSSGTIGLRFDLVNIPKDATIDSAYIEFYSTLSKSTTTNIDIYGQAHDSAPAFDKDIADNISNRTKTSAKVDWNIPVWLGTTKETRIEIGKAVIRELVQDRAISWGYGNWCGKKEWGIPSVDNTLVHVGTAPNTDDHKALLEAAIDATNKENNTPFVESVVAARKYFEKKKQVWVYNAGKKQGDGSDAGSESGGYYDGQACQPTFLIDITDGKGRSPVSDFYDQNPIYKDIISDYGNDNIDNDGDGEIDETDEGKDGLTYLATQHLADAGVSAIGVGFGLDDDSAGMLYGLARAANERGRAHDDDALWGLNPVNPLTLKDEPYFAYNKQELLKSLKAITETIKGAIFHGSAPAATTSVDLGERLILAKFDAGRWNGEIEAVRRLDKSKGWESDNTEVIWTARDLIPNDKATRNVWTITNPADPYTVETYTDDDLPSDNWLCKKLGDIINSTPAVVAKPKYYYPFDGYLSFKADIIYNHTRDPLVYVGANDGQLHAFDLETGRQKWAFVPEILQAKLNKAGLDPSDDPCSTAYCHKYLLDGSPKEADVYADFDGDASKEWRTILVTGLRKGGDAYFALDVTSGEDFDDSTHALGPAKHLWQFTDRGLEHGNPNWSYLGESWSDPVVARVLDATVVATPPQTAWAVYFGSGYAPGYPENAEQLLKQAWLYGITAHDAGDLWKNGVDTANKTPLGTDRVLRLLKVKNYPDNDPSKHFAIGEIIEDYGEEDCRGEGKVVSVEWTSSSTANIYVEDIDDRWDQEDCNAYRGKSNFSHKADKAQNSAKVTVQGAPTNDALATPTVVDMEGNFKNPIADRIFAGNLYGNMHRFVDIGLNQTPSVSTLLTMSHTDNDLNPIRAQADYAFGHDNNYDGVPDNIWVYWGTGRYETQLDKTNDKTQYFFGVKDWNPAQFLPSVKPWPAYKFQVPPADDGIVDLKAKFVTATVRIDGSDVDRTYRVIEGSNDDKKPWVIELFSSVGDPSERVLVKPLVIGGMVFFVTFIPDQNVCAGNGDSWLFAVDFETGLIPTYPVWDINGDGLYDANDMIKIGTDAEGKDILAPPNGVYMGRGQASHLVYHNGYLLYTTTGSGDVDDPDGGGGGFLPNLPNMNVKLRSWRQN